MLFVRTADVEMISFELAILFDFILEFGWGNL